MNKRNQINYSTEQVVPAKSDRAGRWQVDSPCESCLATKRAEAFGLAALERSAENESLPTL